MADTVSKSTVWGKEAGTSATHDFKVDPEFRDLIPPLDSAVREDLKKSIRDEGCRDRLLVCRLDGQNLLLDGHNRYEICRELGKPFETKQIDVSDRTEAKIWILANQRSRRNLKPSQLAMIAAKLDALHAEAAKERKGSRTDLGQKLGRGDPGRSAQKAAEAMSVSHQSVTYAKRVIEKGIEELGKLVYAGKVPVSAAAKVAKLGNEIQAKVVEKIEAQIDEGKRPKIGAVIREFGPRKMEEGAEEPLKKVGIKLEACLGLLEGIKSASNPEKLAEMHDMVQKLTAWLKEIEAKGLDLSSQNPSPNGSGTSSAPNPSEHDSEDEEDEDEEELSPGSVGIMVLFPPVSQDMVGYRTYNPSYYQIP